MNIKEYKQCNLTTSLPGRRKQERKKEVDFGWIKGVLEIPGAQPNVIWEEKYTADGRTKGWAYRV